MKQIKTLTCIGYSQNGDGIVDDKGKQVVVANLIKGEKAVVEIVKARRSMRGKVVKRLTTAEQRVAPPCPYFECCGGCQIQHFCAAEQRDFKQKLVYKALKSFAKIKPLAMMESAQGYRNKCIHSFARAKNGQIIAGLYQNYSHDIVAIERCYIHDQRADDIAQTVRRAMSELAIDPYDEDAKTGHIRHLVTRVAQGTGQLLVTIVTGGNSLPRQKELVAALLAAHPQICGVVQNINSRRDSLVLAKRQRVLYGSAEIVDTLCGKQFKIGAQSFYQVNRSQTEKLYRYALKLADIKPGDTVLDAYCGIGTISLLAADRAKDVIGVELNKTAIANAVQNAALNNQKNVQFVAADAAQYLSKQAPNSFDIVLLDPPREGCSKQLIDSLIRQSAKRIVYISCNPATQARDIKQLTRAGYIVKQIKPFDMFAFTSHVETVALLSKLDVDKHISVEVTMDELDLTSAESKATYKKIKEYILKTNGLKVSNLNIAQIKRKYGIIERENYNKAKNKNSKVPICTEEKEKVIKKALEYFQMI